MLKIKLILILLAILTSGTFLFINYRSYGSLMPDISNVLGSSSKNTQGTTTYPREGYSYVLVKTKAGNFYAHVYKARLSKVNIKTVAANKDTCKRDCPSKPLKLYATENNAIAAMNGSYFCPPDYPSCKNKINSFDFAVYNSNRKTWLNKPALKWFKTAMFTVKGREMKFCTDTTKCNTSGVTAAMSNYPALVHNGEIVVEKGDVQPYQRNKGMKGAIGSDGTYVYMALMPYTTITEAAYTARALGMMYALNIDGGGSSAMYVNGVYKVGPGRLLPNAIVISNL